MLIADLVEIGNALAVGTGRSQSKISGRYFGNSHRLRDLEAGASDMGINKANQIIEKISEDWPADLEVPLALMKWRTAAAERALLDQQNIPPHDAKASEGEALV